MTAFAYPLTSSLVLADYNYQDLDYPLYYRHCSEPDQGLAPQPFKGSWDSIVYVDCKLDVQHERTLSRQLQDLDLFLNNRQFVRVIHFAVNTVEQLECVHNFKFNPNTYTLVEVYLPQLTHTVEHTALIADNLLKLTSRGKILQAQLLTPDSVYTIKPMQTSSLFCLLRDYDHFYYK